MFRDICKVQQGYKEPDCYTCGLCYQEERARNVAYVQANRPLPRNLHADYEAGEVVRYHNRQLFPLYNLERFPTSILDDTLESETSI